MGKLLGSLLGGVWGYVAAAGLAAIVAGGAAVWTTHAVDKGVYLPQVAAKQKQFDDFVLASVEAEKAAVSAALAAQKKQADLAQQQAVVAAQARQKEEDARHKIYTEVDHYVSDSSTCITFGLVRVLNAAAAGVHDPSSLGIAPGQPDDACAGVAWRPFARDIADDYATARENADQLNRLEASVLELHAAAKSQVTSP